MTTPVEFEIESLFDAHVHLRQDEIVSKVAPFTASVCGDAIIMPNRKPPACDYNSINAYYEEIKPHLSNCTPHILAKFMPTTTPDVVREAKAAGAVGFKVYPERATTNSEDGVKLHVLWGLAQYKMKPGEKIPQRGIKDFLSCVEEMQKQDMVLSFHGELRRFVDEWDEILERESNFLPVIRTLLHLFPRLRIVLEHITTKSAVEAVKDWSAWAPGRIAATITPHHLHASLNSLLDGGLHPHLYCMPVVKYNRDRRALVDAIVMDHQYPCFFLGSDTAPHSIGAKECDSGCAGVFNAPCIAESVWEIFLKSYDPDSKRAQMSFENFVSRYGRDFYGFPKSEKRVIMKEERWQVPQTIYEFKPFRAGEILEWRCIPK